MGKATSGSPAREAPHIQAESSDGHAGSATVCADATPRGHSRRPRAGRGGRHRAHAGGRRGQRRGLPAALRPRQGTARAGRCAGAAGRPARPVRDAARRRPERLPPAARASSRATPSWSTSGPPGAPRAGPSSRSSSPRPPPRASRSPSSGSTPATRRDPARRFLRATPLPFPSYVDPKEAIAKTIRAPANYPITVFFDERGKLVYAHQGGYRREADLAADLKRYLQQ